MTKTIAVIFGGQSVEHDVSILSALQFIEAMDTDRYSALPIYVSPDGRWWTGDFLLKRSFYPLTQLNEDQINQVVLGVGDTPRGMGRLTHTKSAFFGAKTTHYYFDLLVPAIHGTNGEDGSLQGLLQFMGLPTAGCSTLAASATMNKAFTKDTLRTVGVPVLDHIIFPRPAEGQHIDEKAVQSALKAKLGDAAFPCIVKPIQLGSSVGVAPAHNIDDLLAALLTVFRLDEAAIVEPLVANMVEYNVAVRNDLDAHDQGRRGVITSAIERPLSGEEFLDFDAKYMRGSKGGAKGGVKAGGPSSDGMASLVRVMHPEELTDAQTKTIRDSAVTASKTLGLAGSVRIDFLCNKETGQLWLNEINTIPGSFAYYLWAEADPIMSFTALTDHIIEEGFQMAKLKLNDTDAMAGRAVIFGRE